MLQGHGGWTPMPCLGDAKKTSITNKITHCVKTNTYATKKLISKLFWTPVSANTAKLKG
jgi:hypothetical protein